MRFAGFAAIAAVGAMLSMPVLAQAPTNTPSGTMVPTKPPVPGIAPGMPMTPPVAKPFAPPATTTMPAPAAKPAPAVKPAATGPVDLNSATAAELDGVKFIGKKRAAKIIAGRPWASADDLVTKKILPKKQFDQVKDRLVVK